MKTGQTQSLASVLATAAVIAWVDPAELSEGGRDDAGLRRILKAAAAVAVICLFVSFGPGLLFNAGENRQASLEGARLVEVAPTSSGTHDRGETPRYAQQ